MDHPNATSTTALLTVADSMDMHTHWMHFDLAERLYEASLTPAQLLDYRRHNGDIANCPGCGLLDQQLVWDEFPDMVGTTTVRTFNCCGYSDSTNSALAYDETGKVVDVL